MKPVADEAGRGDIPVALAEALGPRMHLTKRLLSLHRAQPAPPLHTRRVLPAKRRDTAWALVAGGQQGRCRGVGWGRWDGLIGYGIPTAGRLCAAPISGCGSLAGTSSGPYGLKFKGSVTMRGAHYSFWRGKRNNELIVEPNAHCRAHCSNNEPKCPHC